MLKLTLIKAGVRNNVIELGFTHNEEAHAGRPQVAVIIRVRSPWECPFQMNTGCTLAEIEEALKGATL